MDRKVHFDVYGVPAPQGSKRAIVNRHTGKAVVIESSKKVKPWRDDVHAAAVQAMNGDVPITGAVRLTINFHFLRLASHLNVHGRLKPSAPHHKITYPDLSKLVRSTEDAMTKVVWADDAQVVDLYVTKRFGDTSGAHIEVEVIE